MYRELERQSVSGMSRWTYSVGGISERRCSLTSTRDDEDGAHNDCDDQEASAKGSGNTTTALIAAHTALTAAHIATGILYLIVYLYKIK